MGRSRKKDKRKQKDELLQTTRERLENQRVKNTLTWIFQILVTLVLAAVVAIFFFQPVTMQEGAMEPTLTAGDRFFMNRFSYKTGSPERGDIIIFKTSSSDDAALHIRRVIGLPGEIVQIKDGKILINGETYVEGRDFPVISSGGLATNPVSLGSGEYFVLGDNRNNSEDSRYAGIGTVNKKYIVGKVWFQISPASKLGFIK